MPIRWRDDVLAGEGPLEARLMAYSQERYARCAFVYTFARQWLDDEQSVRTAEDLAVARVRVGAEWFGSDRASDRILNTRVF